MTGTEMFDAIAHIDEDLIEGCLARMKARASERRALAAAEALTENEKKSSPFKRAALTFGAIAAAVVIMLGLISILHIGGKSPTPVEPVVTDSPEPTEDAYALPAPADNSSISVSEGPRAVFVQDGRLYALFGDNTDNVFGDVDTVLEAYSPADGAEEMLFYAVKVPQLIETDVMQAVLFASGTREEYFVAEGTPFACLLFVKTDGSLWVRGSNPGGMFGSADTQNGVKLYDNVKKVFVGERCVFALTENGDYLKWSHDAASDGSSPVLVASGVADGGGDNFYLTEGGRLYADNGENSAVLAENVRSFAVDGNKVIAVLEDGSAKLFTFEMGSMYSGKLSFTEDEYIETGVAYCGISGSAVFVVKEDGALLSPGGYYAWSSGWSRSLDNVVSAYASGGSIYAITEDGTLHRIDPDVTIAQNVSFCRPMAGSEGCLYVTKDGALHRYSPSGGTEDIALPAETLPVRSTDTVAEEILSVPVKWYSYDELSENPALGNEMTYLESIEDMEMVHYSPDAFLIADDGEIAIVDTVGARLCVYDLASGQLKKSVQVGQILEADPIRAAKYDGVYYVLIPYSDSRIVAVYPDGTTSEIPVPQLQGMLEYCRVSEYYAEDGRLILTLIGPDLIMTKAVSLSDGSVTSLYSTQWTLENDTFTVTRNGMIWSFPAEPSSGVRSTRIDVLKVGENGELYVIQEVPIEGQDDMGLYQIYDKDGRLLRCEKIDYFMDSYMTADGGRIVGPDDHLYEMHCDEDAVRIFRIVPAEQTAGTEPTEVPTPEPTEQPTDEPAAQTDTDALRAFFELADENGVKNGKKLFPYYDPNNKRSWSNPRMDPAALSWDENGNLTGIILNACYDISSDCELAGELKLCGFSELKSIKITNTITVRSINVSNCPKLESFGAYGIYDELHFSAARPPEDFNFNPKKMLECRFTEMSDVVLTPGDSACMPCFWGFRNQGDENTYMFIGCDVSNPYTFDCWFDRNGEFYSAESRLSLAEAEPPAGGDWVLSARSKDKEPYYSQYEGTLPTASDMLVSLENGVPAKFDIDFDGIPDTLTAVMTEYSSYDREFALTIVRGAFPDDPFTFSVRGCSNLFAVYVMDCDITDERLDIIFSAGGDIAQQIESLHAFRVDPEGNGILDISFKYDNGLIFTGRRGMFAERGVFDPTKGIPVLIFTDLMDTQGVVGRFTVTNDGLMLISPFCFYPDGPETLFFRELERSMDVTAMNNGVPGEKITLNKGQVFAAYRTDLWSWLELILEDGRIVRAELDTRYGGYLINGIEQDEYCEMHYAG